LTIVVAYGFLSRGTYGGITLPPSCEAYKRVLDPLYLQILWRSIWVATIATLACLLLGFPMAFFVARFARRKTLLLNLIALPFWTSTLIRTYAWMFLLRDTGLVNSILIGTGLVRQPLPLLFNPPAVLLGLVYTNLPFMIFPLYAALEKLDFALLDAAEDLGASPWAAAWNIAVPLAKPGIIAGCVLVFVPCLGAYLIPDLMGGGKSILLGNLIANQFGPARDWPFGAALSTTFLILAVLASLWLRRRGEELL
jgi:spermidine/putrescine transport system permease protein